VDEGAGAGAGAADGLPKFTVGTAREPSDAWKYAGFRWKPPMLAQMLLGKSWMKVL